MPDLVISRYNEKIDWLKYVPDKYRIFLYNKGDEIEPSEALQRVHFYMRIPNVGRETDTYLNHMLYYMNQNDSFTVFSQADPFEHAPHFLSLLELDFTEDVWGYSTQWKQSYPPAAIIKKHLAITGKHSRDEIFSLYNWGPLYSYDWGAFQISHDYFSNYGVDNGTNIAHDFLYRISHFVAGDKALHASLGEFSYGAIFGVQNSIVNRIDRKILINALREVRSYNVVGYVMERLWLHFFGREFISISTVHETILAETEKNAHPSL